MIKDSVIICKLCNSACPIKVLSQHLKIYHGIKYLNYVRENLNDFPGWKLCKICGDKTGNLTCGSFCSRKCSDDWKKISYKGRILHIPTEEDKKKISKKNKEWYATHTHPMLGKHHSTETKIKLSKVNHSGIHNGMYGKAHTPDAIRKIFKHQKMNKLEELAANTLKSAGYKYKFQFFISKDGICKSYDFKIKNLPIIIETDGDYWHGNPNTNHHHATAEATKLNDLIKDDLAKKRGYTVLHIWESEIKQNPNIILDRIKNALIKIK